MSESKPSTPEPDLESMFQSGGGGLGVPGGSALLERFAVLPLLPRVFLALPAPEILKPLSKLVL